MTLVQIETTLLRDAMAAAVETLPERLEAALAAALAGALNTDPPPELPLEDPAALMVTCEGCGVRGDRGAGGWYRTSDDVDLCPMCGAAFVAEAEAGETPAEPAGRRLYRTHYQFVEYNPERSEAHRWRAKDPRPHNGKARPELGTFATEAEAVLAVLEAIEHCPMPFAAIEAWIAASRRKAARVAAEPERSAYAVELALGSVELTARAEA